MYIYMVVYMVVYNNLLIRGIYNASIYCIYPSHSVNDFDIHIINSYDYSTLLQ